MTSTKEESNLRWPFGLSRGIAALCPAITMMIAMAMTLALYSRPLYADDVYTFVIKKQEQKKSTRWSLEDWLETRDRMRLQDLWLALHTSSPYEFFIGGDLRGIRGKSGYDSKLYFSAFATIFGLAIEQESIYTRTNGMFLLRVFGLHNQSTNITLQAGVRSQVEPVSTFSAFAGISVLLYIRRFFGLEGIYRYYFPANGSSYSVNLQERYYEANVFIDFSALRVYGGYNYQSNDLDHPSGYHLGMRFFL